MPEIPDVTFGEVVASEWGNDIRDRTVMRYANQAALDASLPTPVAGDLAFLVDTNFMQIFDGAIWKTWFGGLGTASLQITDAIMAGPRLVDGQPVIRLTAIPSAVAPTYTFHNDVGTGMYRAGANHIGLAVGGVQKLGIATFFTSQPIYDNTVGTPANTTVTDEGRLRRTTSARKYKTDIQPGDTLKDLVLEPVTFHHDGDDADYIGFIADDMPDERAIVRDAGEVENYDLRAVVAILAAKVNALTARVEALEA